MNHVEAIEGCEIAIAVLLEKMCICELYAEVYTGVPLSSQPTNSRQLQRMLDSALPEFYAAIIVIPILRLEVCVFCTPLNYTNANSGMGRFAITLRSFDIEFQPFIEEINAKESVIRQYADAATMERVKSMILHMALDTR